MLLSSTLSSRTRQIELKARCNVSTIDFLGKIWYYKHYNANFFKDAENMQHLIGSQLAKTYRSKDDENDENESGLLIQCDYIKNKSIESWISSYIDFTDFSTELNMTDTYNYKPSKKEVCITALSKGKWIKTNPKIWETNQTYYKINESTHEIQSVISATDPIITGKITAKSKAVSTKATKATKGTKATKSAKPASGVSMPTSGKKQTDVSYLDQHITAVMSLHDTRKCSKYLPDKEIYQFSEILQEDNCCLPFAVIKKSEHNRSIVQDCQQLFVQNLHKTFSIEADIANIGMISVPKTSPLLKDPSESVVLLYYCDGNIRFDTLSDQRRWWKSIQSDIDSDPKKSNFKYFELNNNKYQQRYHIEFDIYKPGTSIPMLIMETGKKLPVSPSTCYPRTREDLPSTLKFKQENHFEPKLPFFTRSQLENALKIAFPGINTDSFRQIANNSISFQRKNCLMSLLKDLDKHKCKEPEGTIVFNTAFSQKENNKNAICELLYYCDCASSKEGEHLAFINKPLSSSKKRKRKKKKEAKCSFEPVNLDEKVSFPENLNFENTVKNTDIGFADVFKSLYKDRYIYNPEDSCFYYFDGNVWQQDKTGGFTDTLIASKLSSCMDEHIKEFEDEQDREESRQKLNKPLLNKLRKKMKDMTDQRKRLTNGYSKVKTFIKPLITDKYFGRKIVHPGKLAASNGFIDLRTLNIDAFKPRDYVTEKCDFAYYKCSCKPGECMKRDEHGNIQCNSIIAKQMQKLDDIIREIMGCDCENDDGTLKYGDDLYYHFMWAIGYGLSGEGNKKYLMYCHSPANSGKSLLLEAITEIMPQYFGVVPKGALFGKKSANGPTPELVLIQDKRAGFCDEVGKDDHFDDRNAKALTGRSKIEWRKMGGEYQVTKFKIVPYVAANQYVEIDCLDPAFWDRLMPILFPIHFSRKGKGVSKDTKKGTERLRDETIVDKFETEPYLIAYFNWVVRSCAYFYSDIDKPIPKPIIDKINELKKESFALDEFINNSDNYEFSDDDADKVPIKAFYDEFKKYAQDNNIKSKMGYSLTQFRNMIREMSKESNGYDRKISIDDSKGKTVKSCIKGIKQTFGVINVNQEYSHTGKYSSYRPMSPTQNSKRPRNDDDDDDDASIQPPGFDPTKPKKQKIDNLEYV